MKHRKPSFFQALIFLNSLIILIFWVYPSFSHTNHPHSPVKTESSPQINTSEPKISPTPQAQTTPLIQQAQLQNSSSDLMLTPQPSEILGFLLIVNPFLLYTLRKKLHRFKQ